MSLNLMRFFATFFAVLILAFSGPVIATEGMLVITSNPGGAKIYIDGARKGTTPVQRGKDLVLRTGRRAETSIDDEDGDLIFLRNHPQFFYAPPMLGFLGQTPEHLR